MKKIFIALLATIFLVGCGGDDKVITTFDDNGILVSGEVEGEGAEAAEGSDECLIGSWKVINFSEYLQAMVAENTDGVMNAELTSTDTGDLIISFDDDFMRMSDNNFQVTATMMGITVPVDIDASGEAPYEAENGRIVTSSSQADVTGNGSYSVNLTTLTASDVDYECDAGSLVWKAGDNFAVDIMLERI